MKEIIIATSNENKLREFEEIIQSYFDEEIKIYSLLDYPQIGEIEETGSTFEENSAIKSRTLTKLCKKIVIADDSGLCVDALNGEPGVYSARYSKDHDYEANKKKLYEKLGDKPGDCYYETCITMTEADGITTHYFTDIIHGKIIHESRGTGGFAYDDIFLITDGEFAGKTMAELTEKEKAKISSRAKALRMLLQSGYI